ncbi:MAG: glutamine-synthetase adenylyltransferase, partial [Pseudomonadota bacterium]
MNGIAARQTRVPLAYDPGRGRSVLDALDPSLRGPDWSDLLVGAAGSSPYLARLIGRHGDWLAAHAPKSPDDILAVCLADVAAKAAGSDAAAALMREIRVAKGRAAMITALADLAGAWDLNAVTGALTRTADTLCEAAAAWLLSRESPSGANDAGYCLLAMGKMGAGELNFSSDIDLIALFDDSRYPPSEVLEARTRFVKLTRSLVKLLSENTADGYGFRVDLRLRPSPSTTPVCMAMDAAERYYESVGRTWERAAHIKARPLIDPAAGQAYLDRLTPFIWRRHLDFAALEDVTEMLRKIRSQKGPFPAGSLPGQDIKLGPGGVREIEFFAQTRQLILGGRNPLLRVRPTMDALSALADAGEISADHANALTAHLTALRTWEHRFQMLEDAQTHTVPKSAEARSRVAALSGFASAEAFQADLAAHMAGTHSLTEAFFTPAGSDDPDANAMPTETTLSELGFAEPARAAAVIQRWHNGQIPATRGERSQRLYAGLEETIIQQLGKAASPDQALIQFDRFLSGLPAGVQVFSLFTANLQLLSLIVEICAAAPRLAAYLGRCAQVLDALLDRDFWEPLAGEAALHSDLQDRLKQGQDYEARLDIARRWARELWFRTGVQVLRGIADAAEAGRAFTAIATASIRALLPEVTANFAERHGSPPGHDLAVLALGKLGSAEMTAGSDLDLIIIYDAEG